jgi:hypothetical protein
MHCNFNRSRLQFRSRPTGEPDLSDNEPKNQPTADDAAQVRHLARSLEIHVRLSQRDQELIDFIRTSYGISMSAAVRVGLRAAAEKLNKGQMF